MIDNQVVVKLKKIPTEWSHLQLIDDVEFKGHTIPASNARIEMPPDGLATLILTIPRFRVEYVEGDDDEADSSS